MRVLIADVRCLSDEGLYSRACALVDEKRRQQAERMHGEADRRRCIGAGILLNAALRAHAAQEAPGFSCCDLVKAVKYYDERLNYPVAHMPGGKPYFEGRTDLYFNLSHSGDYAACVLADRPAGIDIEGKRNVSGSLAKRFYSEAECAWIKQGNDKEEQETRFFRLWTLKEAYGKVTGEGLASSLKSAYFAPDDNKKQGDGTEEEKLMFCDAGQAGRYDVLEWQRDGYRIAAACQKPGIAKDGLL